LNCTFPGRDYYSPARLMAMLSKIMKRDVSGLLGRGIFGFDQSMKLYTRVGSSEFAIGCLAFGGEAQKGRWMFQLTGSGCSVVPCWRRLVRLLRALDARLTRLDLALDCLHGEYTVNDAVQMYHEGDFNSGGRSPSTALAGDWLGGHAGRTLYVGKAVNGKMLRVYEKGMQLGDPDSDWVRFEVQLGNRDRVIPFEAITLRDAFLAGCYPALEKMLSVAGLVIPTAQTEGQTSIGRLMFHLKRSYGKLINTVFQGLDCSSMELVESVTVLGVPRRLKPSDVDSGLTWEQLLSQLRKA
jgi:phage replication initiation protein